MATYTAWSRTGLPRVSGGDPWPPHFELSGSVGGTTPPVHHSVASTTSTPADDAALPSHAATVTEMTPIETATSETTAPELEVADHAAPEHTTSVEQPAANEEQVTESNGAALAAPVVGGSGGVRIRRGLPRDSSGEPWPIVPEGWADAAASSESLATGNDEMATAEPGSPMGQPAADSTEQAVSATPAAEPAASATTALAPVAAGGGDLPAVTADSGDRTTVTLRRGLPRDTSGEAWPVVTGGTIEVPAAALGNAAKSTGDSAATSVNRVAADAPQSQSDQTSQPDQVSQATPVAASAQAARPAESSSAAASAAPARPVQDPSTAQPAAPARPAAAAHGATAPTAKAPSSSSTPARPAPTRPAASSATAGGASAAKTAPATPAEKPKEAKLYGSRTLGQWLKLGVLSVLGALAAAAILILAARGVTTLPGVPEFLERYPGEYHLPESAEPGFPWWVRWSHFLNIFLMVLIIRTGLQVRTQQKPPAYWTPKKGGKKVSINLWLHQSLDVIWLLNGLAFVVLLLASGHWMRIVPTSWEVFPNAASAMLQYMTLDWPVENGWVNYNGLQQLMYFLVVFVAAPLAALTGVRMSEWWPKNAKLLNKIFPVEVARAIHFPTMLFFVFFIVVHVFLVFATGALRNLNHMYAGQDVVNWTGFFLFAASLLVIVGGWFAARPLVLAPIARLFGQVSSR